MMKRSPYSRTPPGVRELKRREYYMHSGGSSRTPPGVRELKHCRV